MFFNANIPQTPSGKRNGILLEISSAPAAPGSVSVYSLDPNKATLERGGGMGVVVRLKLHSNIFSFFYCFNHCGIYRNILFGVLNFKVV